MQGCLPPSYGVRSGAPVAVPRERRVVDDRPRGGASWLVRRRGPGALRARAGPSSELAHALPRFARGMSSDTEVSSRARARAPGPLRLGCRRPEALGAALGATLQARGGGARAGRAASDRRLSLAPERPPAEASFGYGIAPELRAVAVSAARSWHRRLRLEPEPVPVPARVPRPPTRIGQGHGLGLGLEKERRERSGRSPMRRMSRASVAEGRRLHDFGGEAG